MTELLTQVDACMNQDGIMEMPIYNLPSKILFRVMHVHLKVSAINVPLIGKMERLDFQEVKMQM